MIFNFYFYMEKFGTLAVQIYPYFIFPEINNLLFEFDGIRLDLVILIQTLFVMG